MPEAAIASGIDDLEPCVDELADLGVRLQAPLHAGPIVEVWRATLPSGELAAVKLLKRRWLGHPGAVELVRRERRAISSMQHPHVVRAVDFFDRGGCVALATEYLACGDLVSLAGSEPEHWVDAALDVVSALEHVHARGYAHADVKARNVLFDAGERAKLVDFGAALPLGAPLPSGGSTRAPRPQCCGFVRRSAAPGARAGREVDVYALAVLIYELLSGRLPVRPDAGADEEGGAQALRRPLEACALGSKSLLALVDRVMATLNAADAAAVGTLMQFGNVLESVRSGLRDRSRD